MTKKSTSATKDPIISNLKKPFTWLLMLLVIALVFLVPPVLINFGIADWADYSTTGQIGDTIGGITSPIVNLISAFLVFFALKAQIDANNIIQEQINEEKVARSQENQSKELTTLFSYLDKTVSSIEYVSPNGPVHIGTKAILNILTRTINLSHFGSSELAVPEYASVFSSLRLYEMLLEKIQTSIAPIEERELLNEMASHSYYTYHGAANNIALEKNKNTGVCDQCKKRHTLSDEHVQITNNIVSLINSNKLVFSDYRNQKRFESGEMQRDFKNVMNELKKEERSNK